MSPCNPNDTHINLPSVSGTPLAPFGSIPFSPPQLPIPNLDIPNIESVLDLINSFKIVLPSGTLKPNLDDTTNSALVAITNLLDQFAPFLSIYNFFQPAFNMILCILEVICAFPNPWKMFKALRRLFKKCLPDFLHLFPWIALLAMIISLLLLIISLIEYIIATVEKIIEDLIANLTNLAEGLTLQNDDAVSATAKKIAQLLCLIENLFSILVAIGAIIDIINALAGLRGKSACGGGGAPGANIDDDCCSSDFCPNFITDNPNGITGSLGELTYYHRIDTDIRGMFSSLSPQQVAQFNLPAVRSESWQFVNQDLNQLYPFLDIITPLGEQENYFWPEGLSFTKDARPSKVPYTLNLTFNHLDPNFFNHGDRLGSRKIILKDVIVSKKPYIGVINQNNNIDTSINNAGTLSLTGGLAYQIDPKKGEVPYYDANGYQASIDSLFHSPNTYGNLPGYDDGYVVSDIDFTLNVNYTALIGYGLITLGCHPDLFVERLIANQRVGSVGFDSIAVKLPPVGPGGNILPDVTAAQSCLTTAMAKLRANISTETVAEFQAEISACLNQLKDETNSAYCNILKAAVSVFESTVTNDVDVQFTTRKIKTTVRLYDPNKTLISTGITAACAQEIVSLLKGTVTLGKISDFTYDGINGFVAEISSNNAGFGTLTVSYDGNTLKKVSNLDDNSKQTVSEDNILTYQFVNVNSDAESVRRDESDVARDDRA